MANSKLLLRKLLLKMVTKVSCPCRAAAAAAVANAS
jgi:hypothetical protein